MVEPPTFLSEPPETDASRAAYAADRDEDGYVMNFTRLWSWRPDVKETFVALRSTLGGESSLAPRELALLNASTASARGDSYCSLAWGPRLAGLSSRETAAQVLADEPAPALSAREAALAAWARQVVRDPNAITEADVEALRAAGLDDREIFEATAFTALRLAFSTINNALGAAPDLQLADAAPEEIRAAITFGRPPAAEPSRA